MEEMRQFVSLVRDNPDESNNVGGCSEEQLLRAEEMLGVSFPPTFRTFLRELGDCDIGGEEFYGVFEKEGVLEGAVEETLDLRQQTGMPDSLIAFRPDGMGGHFVLDASKPVGDGEFPVYAWEGDPTKADDELEYIGSDFGTVALRLARRGLGLDA